MNPANILVVDDEPQIRRVMRSTLNSHGYVILEAKTGEEAIEVARIEKPDLILLDVSMPNLDGISATPQLREKVPEAGILILTLHESLDLARMAAKAGAWGFVTKSLAATDSIPAIEAFQASVSAPAK